MIDADLKADLVRLAERAPMREDGWERVLVGRARRRRRRRALTAMLVVLGLIGGVAAVTASRGPATKLETTSGPQGLAPVPGRVAWVRDGRLFTREGAGAIESLGGDSALVEQPSWSRDAAHLAAIIDKQLEVFASGRGPATTMLVSEQAAFYEWSPTDDALLFVTGPGALYTWSIGDAPPRQIADAHVYSAKWSPDGTRIAYATRLVADGRDDLTIASVDGQAPSSFLVASTFDDSGLDIATWSPDQTRLLVWPDPAHSSSIAADGLELVSYPALSEGSPVTLGSMLWYPDWLTWSPDGQRLAFVSGTGRFLGDRKVITVCDSAAGPCRALDQPADVSVADVDWSPDGHHLVVTRGAALSGDSPLMGNTVAFDQSRRLFWIDPADGAAHPVDGAPGDFAARRPRWIDSGRLLVETDAGLMVVGLTPGEPQLVTPPVDVWALAPSA